MITKIQNLNGTHNRFHAFFAVLGVVYDYKDTKFEWNSQLTAERWVQIIVVYDYKDTKFEWNSQPIQHYWIEEIGCL